MVSVDNKGNNIYRRKKAPAFMVYALLDSIGGNLDRIQIINMRIPKRAPVSTQERAYTSSIWYTPGK